MQGSRSELEALCSTLLYICTYVVRTWGGWLQLLLLGGDGSLAADGGWRVLEGLADFVRRQMHCTKSKP